VSRADGRSPDELRPVTITLGWQETAYASALVEVGRTRVVCAATYEDRAPGFLRGSGKGWVTAEYAMLPGSTVERSPREVARGRPGGRTHEIQRLIGRALRAVIGKARSFPLRDHVAAVSAGIIDGVPCLDLPYQEDVRAETDMNVVMTGLGGLVEVQGTAERAPFSREELDAMLDLAGQGIAELVLAQKLALGDLLEEAAIPPLRRIALGPARPAAKA